MQEPPGVLGIPLTNAEGLCRDGGLLPRGCTLQAALDLSRLQESKTLRFKTLLALGPTTDRSVGMLLFLEVETLLL